jgi:nicotinate phosphoribosyltransferase
LIDTFSDEKIAAIKAFETLGSDLYGVRLDTPSSRRGDLKKIAQEVRWELDIRGGEKVKIFVSGGLDETQIVELRDSVDGFGIGTSISAAPVMDFGGKIVSVEDEATGNQIPRSKRGDLSGVKNVFREGASFSDVVTISSEPLVASYSQMLKPLIRNGVIVRDFLPLEELQRRTVKAVKAVSNSSPSISWK